MTYPTEFFNRESRESWERAPTPPVDNPKSDHQLCVPCQQRGKGRSCAPCIHNGFRMDHSVVKEAALRKQIDEFEKRAPNEWDHDSAHPIHNRPEQDRPTPTPTYDPNPEDWKGVQWGFPTRPADPYAYGGNAWRPHDPHAYGGADATGDAGGYGFSRDAYPQRRARPLLDQFNYPGNDDIDAY